MLHNWIYICLAFAHAGLALKSNCGSFDGRNANERTNSSAIKGQTNQTKNGKLGSR